MAANLIVTVTATNIFIIFPGELRESYRQVLDRVFFVCILFFAGVRHCTPSWSRKTKLWKTEERNQEPCGEGNLYVSAVQPTFRKYRLAPSIASLAGEQSGLNAF